MKTYTDLEKIEEIKLGIRILNNIHIKPLQLEISKSRLCDCQEKIDELHAYRKRIENMEDRIEELKLVW